MAAGVQREPTEPAWGAAGSDDLESPHCHCSEPFGGDRHRHRIIRVLVAGGEDDHDVAVVVPDCDFGNPEGGLAGLGEVRSRISGGFSRAKSFKSATMVLTRRASASIATGVCG